MGQTPTRPNFLKDIETLQTQVRRLRAIVGSVMSNIASPMNLVSPDGAIVVQDSGGNTKLTLGYQSSGGAIGISTAGSITSGSIGATGTITATSTIAGGGTISASGALQGATLQTGGGTVLSFTIGSDAYGTVLDITTH